MKRRFAFVLLVCCGSSATAPSSPPVANTKPGPTVLSFRVLDLRRQDPVLAVFKLTIDGTRATLNMRGSSTSMPADGGEVCLKIGDGPQQCKPATTIEMWRDEMTGTMTGTATKHATGFDFDFPREDPESPHLVMTCTEQDVDVAPATAVVIADPQCAPLRWSLPTERLRLLGCASRSSGDTVFSPSPGIEQVDVENLDCGDRAPMFRRVPADQSVRQALAPS